MKRQLATAAERLDATLMALAHPARREMLRRLAESDERVTALAKPFAMSLNAVSKHIRVLERARMVERRRRGREHVLSLRPEALNEAETWLAEQRIAWAERLEALEDALRTEDQETGRWVRRARRIRRKSFEEKQKPFGTAD